MKEIKIGLIGFGTVGTGVVRVLQENAPLIEQRLGGRIRLHRIADIDLARHREVQVPQEILTTDAEAVLSDPEIAICVELMGGIEPARTFILKAMQSGKHVVTTRPSWPSTGLRSLTLPRHTVCGSALRQAWAEASPSSAPSEKGWWPTGSSPSLRS
jgi:hypothetical protein